MDLEFRVRTETGADIWDAVKRIPTMMVETRRTGKQVQQSDRSCGLGWRSVGWKALKRLEIVSGNAESRVEATVLMGGRRFCRLVESAECE